MVRALLSLAIGAALLPFAALSAGSASALNPAPLPGDTLESIRVGNVTRTYVLHVPARREGAVPLVLAFHGHFGTGAEFSRLTNLDALADAKTFIVAYPDGIDRGWDDGRALDRGHNDLGMVDALIAALSKRYRIDAKRIYATGFSNGGTFSQYLACARSTVIAAIGSVAGPLPEATAATCRPARAISVIEMHGTKDPLVPYSGGQVHILGFERGAVWSPTRTIRFWARNARCSSNTTVELPKTVPGDPTAASVTTFTGCAPGSGAQFVTISDGGHTWPGGPQYLPPGIVGIASRQIDASARIVTFFLTHPLR